MDSDLIREKSYKFQRVEMLSRVGVAENRAKNIISGDEKLNFSPLGIFQ